MVRGLVRSASAAGALLFSIATASPASALGTLDQSVTGTLYWYSGVYEDVQIAQTFTAGISGVVDRVTLDLSREGLPGDLVVEIYRCVDDLPSGDPLATEHLADSEVTEDMGTIAIDFDAPAEVEAGTRYVIVASAPDAWAPDPDSDTPIYRWGAESNPVAEEAGLSWYNDAWHLDSSTDYRFATYVSDPPSPADDSGNSLAETGFAWTNTGIFGSVMMLSGLGFVVVQVLVRTLRRMNG